LESEGKASYNIRAGDVKEVVPADESTHKPWIEGRQHTITRKKRIRQWAEEIVGCTGLVSSQREQRLKNISLRMFISDKISYDRRRQRSLLTVVDLLQRNLGILGQTLLSFAAQHEGLWLLRRGHRRMML
jgi:hypothetical protein